MIEITLEYWNRLASQIIVISSLLGGFSIAIVANLLVHDKTSRISNLILKVTIISSGCFLAALFSMTKILMMTTPGYPLEFEESNLLMPRAIGFTTFVLGIIALSAFIALSGWTKSKKMGVFTTAIAAITLLIILIMII